MRYLSIAAPLGFALVTAFVTAAGADELTKTQFVQLDGDGDGYLSRTEISAQPEYSRWMQISTYGSFDLADVNADDRVDQSEFSAFEQLLPVE